MSAMRHVACMYPSVYVCVYLFACQKLCLDIGNDVSSSEKHKSKLLLLNRTQAPKISIALGNWTQAAPQRICVARAAASYSSPTPQSIKFRVAKTSKNAGHINVTAPLCVCVQDNCNRLTCRLITVWGRRRPLEMCQIGSSNNRKNRRAGK